MNIPPHIPQVVVNSAAPSTEALAKSNAVKEVIPATVKTEATVPHKSREQEARAPAENITYDNIQSNNDPEEIPEDDGQSYREGEQHETAQQEQEKPQETDEQNDTNANASNQSAEQAEQQEQAAEQKVDDQVEQRDREVKAHEQAHAAIGGALAGSPSYSYQTGPDGKRYAVGGEVPIDVSIEADPEETIRKMQIVQAAALAPAEPSSQDRKVAAQAARNITEARADIVAESSALTSSNNQKSEEAQPEVDIKVGTAANAPAEFGSELETGKTDTELAKIFNGQDNANTTAQVVSKKYASSFQTKEIFFNAVA